MAETLAGNLAATWLVHAPVSVVETGPCMARGFLSSRPWPHDMRRS